MTAGSGLTHQKTSNTSRDFLLWSCYGDRSVAPHSPLHGAKKRLVWQQRQAEMSFAFCARENANTLIAARTGGRGPKHMRSDVDRVVFGHDLDASEAAVVQDVKRGETTSNWNAKRLQRDTPGSHGAGEAANAPLSHRRLRPQSAQAWVGQRHAYITVEPLNVGTPRSEVSIRRIGASRPTAVNPRPASAQAQNILKVQRELNTSAYQEELNRWHARRLGASLRSTRRPAPTLGGAFHFTQGDAGGSDLPR